MAWQQWSKRSGASSGYGGATWGQKEWRGGKEWQARQWQWWPQAAAAEWPQAAASDTTRDTEKSDSEDGDPKVIAAAKAAMLEEALAQLGEDPLLATARQELEKMLLKQRKLAKDTRSTAKKLDQKQHWIERESKRLEVETKRLATGRRIWRSGRSSSRWKSRR